MPRRCATCGEESVKRDDEAGSEVCTSCGTVASQVSNLTNNDSQIVSRFRQTSNMLLTKRMERMYHSEEVVVPKDIWHHVTYVCQVLGMPDNVKEQAQEMLKLLREKNDLKRFHLEQRNLCASACVFIAARRNQCAVALQLFCNLERASKFEFGRVKEKICISLKMESNFIQDRKSVNATLLALIKPEVTVCDDMKKDINDILSLCNDAWLTEGRKPTSVVGCAYFLAWQAEDYPKRKTTKITSFAKNMFRTPSTTLPARLKEISNVLLELAKGIPWLSGIESKKLPLYLKDILQYKSSLQYDAGKRIAKDSSDAAEASSLPSNFLKACTSQS